MLRGRVGDLSHPRARGLRRMWRRPAPSAASIRELADTLASDPRAAGLIVEIDQVSGGHATLASLRDALASVRAAGKDVVAFLPSGGDTDAMYVASAARRIVIAPATLIAPLGYAVQRRYVHRALERHGVKPQIFARGVYKSAAETLVRDGMSDAEREQLGALLDVFHERFIAALATGRAVDRTVAAGWVDAGLHTAENALELGLVDAVAYDDELDDIVLRGGLDGERQPPLRSAPAARYLKAHAALKRRPARRGVIGVVEVRGPIVSRSRGLGVAPIAADGPIVAALRAARRSRAVRGVVLHIDSPGGSSAASDRIHHEVARLAATKPVVAYLSNIAASGGYYVASGAHAIVAQPETITGSIGVVSARFALNAFFDRLGVSTDLVKRGAHADLFSSARPLDAAEQAAIDRAIDATYATFLRVVATGRRRSIDDIEPLARGRVYSGTDAHARGLVDELGGFGRAVELVRERAGIPPADRIEPRVVTPPRTAIGKSYAESRASLVALAAELGLDDLAPALELAAATRGELVLLYWPPVAG